jgi:hypothetical protein
VKDPVSWLPASSIFNPQSSIRNPQFLIFNLLPACNNPGIPVSSQQSAVSSRQSAVRSLHPGSRLIFTSHWPLATGNFFYFFPKNFSDETLSQLGEPK